MKDYTHRAWVTHLASVISFYWIPLFLLIFFHILVLHSNKSESESGANIRLRNRK